MEADDAGEAAEAAEAAEAEDGERWLVIDGRRWRRTDPELPADIVAALKSHLGRARSAVRTAKRAGDEEALGTARARVGVAKSGLGERGPQWWEDGVAARVDRARDAVAQLDGEESAS